MTVSGTRNRDPENYAAVEVQENGEAGRVLSSDRESRFLLRELLGQGGMCEIYAAVDLRRVEYGDARPLVALKRLLPEMSYLRQAQLSLAQEFFTLRHLAHTGIVRAYDLHCEAWGVCFSMELLEGVPASAFLASHSSGYGHVGISVAAQIFGALSYLHELGVIHGDIKPGNIILEQGMRPVLVDFNASRTDQRSAKRGRLVGLGSGSVGCIPGLSVLHASPERLAGLPPTQEGDVFSVCCTVYELLTGEHPFRLMNAVEAVANGIVPNRPAVLGKRQWSALLLGLSVDPDRRPPAGDLWKAFCKRSWFERLRGARDTSES